MKVTTKLGLGAVALSMAVGAAGCSGGMTLAPHLNREHELGPAAAAGRFGVVADRASAFEVQNAKSRDVHWYRMWRASAMLGMGQLDQAIALIDQTLADVSNAPSPPAQADRLRMFGYDLRARANLLENRPQDALADLDRSFALANEVALETRGECDQSMALTARARQLEDVAKKAGDASRADKAHVALGRQLDKWLKCLAEQDYPGLAVMGSLADVIGKVDGATALAPAKADEKPAKKELAKKEPPPAKLEEKPAPQKPAPEEKPAKAPTGLAALSTTEAQYAPVDPTPWKAAIESALALAGKHAQGVKGDVVIRTDGAHHALRLRLTIPRFDNPEQLAPLFRSTVVFFEQTRAILPKVDRVLITVEGGSAPIHVLAKKDDVLELFQERLDAASFTKRLVRVL